MGFASCKAFGRSISASLPKPQTPSPWEGAILLGLPPLDPVGGYAPKQGCFGCLPKVLHDAKPAEQATLDTPFLYNQEVYRQSDRRHSLRFLFVYIALKCPLKQTNFAT